MSVHEDILSGNKGKKGGTASANTLRSKTRAGIILAIGEGPIKGLTNGAKSIFLNKTPLENADGSLNFENVFWQFHNGYPDDGHFNGFNSVATPFTVNAPVKKNLGGVTRTIVEPLADAVKVIMRLDALFSVNDKGAMRTTSVSYGIDLRPAGGAWTRQLTNEIVNEKCTSPTQIEHRIELPLGGAPWDVRVVRLTNDTPVEDEEKLQNGTTWDSYLVLVEEKFTYPNTAAIAVEVNAEDIGGSMPEITVEIDAREIKVPTNYDPEARTYSGIWDGTFKVAWSNNPAWIYYDIANNNIFGIGDLIDVTAINKWALYAISQECDGLVKSGYKTPLGVDIMEPRYTFNGVITDKRSAFAALRAITTTWRGMSYWSHGQVFTTIDAPQDVARIFGPSNVAEGRFDYSETSIRARHSVVLVRWNDPNDHFAPANEVYVDDELLRQYGWRDKSVSLEGCTSRSLARRYAKWIIDTEKHEVESVTFTASWDNLQAVPGEIIEISDPRRAQVLMSGRITGKSSTRIDLDTDFEPQVGASYTIRVQMADGTLESHDVLQTYPLEKRRLRVASFANEVLPDASYIITGTDVKPRSYRILSVDETDNEMFTVTALQHDPDKYARVEQGIKFEPIPYTRDQNIISAPTGLVADEVTFNAPGGASTEVAFSWRAPVGVPVRGYIVQINTPSDGTTRLAETTQNTVTYVAPEPGIYTFTVQAVSFTGARSQAVLLSHTVEGLARIGTGVVSNLANAANGVGGTTTFAGRDVRITWKSEFADSSDTGSAVMSEDNTHLYSHNTVNVYSGATLLRSQRVAGSHFVYSYDMHREDALAASLASPARSLRIEVTVTDTLGRVSSPAQIILTNSVPAMLTPVVSSVGREVKVAWAMPDDADAAGVMVWVETSSGFDPYATVPKFDSTGSNFTFLASPTQTYYVRTAAYDLFGKTGLNISAAITVATGFDLNDAVAPGVPAGLTLTSSMLTPTQGKLVATWTANAESDLLGYEVQIKQGAGSYIGTQTSTNRHEWDVQPGVAYTVRVRSLDRTQNRSAFSAESSHTTTKDSVAPAVPAGLVATGGFETIWLKMTRNAETDFSHYEIYESATTTAPLVGTAATYKSASEAIVRSGLPDAVQTLHYWARSVDTSGNKSAWSARVQATTETVQGLIQNSINASTWSSNLGFLIGGQIAAPQIPSSIVTADKIAESAVSAEKIAANAVSVAKIAPDLNTFIASQGVSAAGDAAAANTAKLAAQTAATAALGYKDETILLRDAVDVKSVEITQTAGVVAAAKNTSVLASGNERFQFELTGWQMTGGRLTNLLEYRRGAVDALFVFDVKNNVHQGIAVNFARATTSTVTILGTSYTVPVNKPRFFVTVGDGRYLTTSSGETIGIAAALGTVDVEITPRVGAKVVQKGVALASGWWPAHGDYFSVVVWPSGTL